MKDSEKYLGFIFLAIAVIDLVRQDWLGFLVLGLAGAGLLWGSKLKLSKTAEIGFAFVFFALVIARLVMLFLS